MNALETAIEIITDIKSADKQIENTPIGATCDVDIPALDVPLRLRGNKQVQIVAVTLKRKK